MKSAPISALALVALLGASPALAQDASALNAATYNETRISALEEQMRDLNGRVEQVEFSVHRIDQALQRMQADTDARLARLESAPPPAPVVASQPAAQPVAPAAAALQAAAQQPAIPVDQAPVPTPNGTLGALKIQDGKVTGGVNSPQAPALPAAPPDYGLTPQEQYERAFNLLRQANYPEAETAFKAFIDKNPKDKLIDNAKYWYGETLYVRAQFDASAVAFADAYQQNPQGSKAPDSLLKLGMSLGALNKTADACVTLNELKTKYPNAAAPIKQRAEQERSQLKCPAR